MRVKSEVLKTGKCQDYLLTNEAIQQLRNSLVGTKVFMGDSSLVADFVGTVKGVNDDILEIDTPTELERNYRSDIHFDAIVDSGQIVAISNVERVGLLEDWQDRDNWTLVHP